ncbi:MAG: GIY-YIG nuclease family protein [Proteobacteria bacterium]|nr:MAG: GIY-YIG nuclease family protein [Pseudomonadota bacterium]
MKNPATYILASKQNGTLYIGSTDNLKKRVYQHKNELLSGFTQKYSVKKLVYFEQYDLMTDAALREKQHKKWKRQWEIDLIEKDNPNWDDLWDLVIQ